MVSFGFGLFEVLILKRFVFGVSGIVSKVLKMLVFPIVWAFLGWRVIVHLGLEGLGVFVFLVFVFLCCVAFVSVFLLCYWFCGFFFFFLLFFFCFLFVLFFFVFLFVLFFLFCFFGGFKGQVRWPKGPPHLALNPPYFLVFVFCLLFFCFLCLFLGFLFFLCFCFFWGFKGQVRWPKGPPHLALNPPYFLFCFFFFSFAFSLFVFLIGKPTFSP